VNKTKIEAAFVDERGSIWDFLTDKEVHHVGFLISKKNSIRGKHYHKEQEQYTLVLNGKMKIITKNIQNKDSKVEETILEKMEMVKFPPFYYHALESLEDSECLVLTSKGRAGQDYEEDTIRVNDIENYEVL
jgi:dTDP-4-dehydrorhamnose 3,5-epimerase-like enzyme